MKIKNTTPVVPPPPKTFSIELSEAELFHITLVIGSMSKDRIREIYGEKWRTESIMGRNDVEFPYDDGLNSQLYEVCYRAL